MRKPTAVSLVALIVWASAPVACSRDAKDPATAEQAQAEPERGGGGFFGIGGSKRKRDASKTPPSAPALTLRAVDLSDAVRPIPRDGGVDLRAAKNEWTSFVVEIGPRDEGETYTLQFGSLVNDAAANATIPSAGFEVYQALSMPVDVNRAGYARHTGQDASRGELPRALLPMACDADGVVALSSLRSSARPSDPAAAAPPAEPTLLWVDVRVPPDAVPGEYAATCDVIRTSNSKGKGKRKAKREVVASVPLKLLVHDFALPPQRNLQVVGRLSWDDLERLYPDRFEAIRPRLMNRTDKAYAGAIRTLDALLALAHRHRTSLVVPRLQPTVKWTPNEPPDVDWREYDSLVKPWLSGEAFEDRMPVGFWPLPAFDLFDNYALPLQLQYWQAAATHFDQEFDDTEWLERAPVWMEKVTPGPASETESLDLSRVAAETLAIHQRLRVSVPLETDQLYVAETDGAIDPKRLPIDPATTARLLSAAPGLVFAPPMRLWPDAAARPTQYLRADMPAVLPYVGAGGDERDVRVWAWLAFLRQASLIHFADALPSLDNPTEPADPNELIWFYPGEWFGLDQPVPTIQLKWLRRAQQDYEYLWLARQRGTVDTRANTLLMAQLLAKPVEIQPGQTPDPVYTLMSGTTDQRVWDEAQRLVSEMILLYPQKDQPADPDRERAVHLQTLPWAEPQERPLLLARTADWAVEFDPPKARLHVRFGVDIYNASAVTPQANLLAWSGAPIGWELGAQPTSVPVLATFNVRRAALEAKFNLDQLTPAASREPMEVTFTNGYNNRQAKLRFMLPVATTDRREGEIKIDGDLADDWDPADLAHSGGLVKMLSRPSLQRQQIELAAATPSNVYTCWAENWFYVAFDLSGIKSGGTASGQNFVDYQFRRAWGEDLCQILVQPVSANGVAGSVLHVVCKPNGSSWVERKLPNTVSDDPKAWQEVEARIPYVSKTDADKWRGEVRIPWRAILSAAAGADDGNRDPLDPPVLLRFNFIQHRTATGESASWAGPLDFGRDDAFMGVLMLRDPEDRRANNIAEGGTRIRVSPEER